MLVGRFSRTCPVANYVNIRRSLSRSHGDIATAAIAIRAVLAEIRRAVSRHASARLFGVSMAASKCHGLASKQDELV